MYIKNGDILLMEEILHQLIGSLSHYLQGVLHPRWLAGFLPSTVPHKWPHKWLEGYQMAPLFFLDKKKLPTWSFKATHPMGG